MKVKNVDKYFIKEIKRRITNSFPRIIEIYRVITGRPENTTFNGWGMKTYTTMPPWLSASEPNNATKAFIKTHEKLLLKVNKSEFKLSQFEDGRDINKTLESLMWRHYIVFSSVWMVLEREKSNSEIAEFVECGVCDGLTSYYALSAVQEHKCEARYYLYDSWGGMRNSDLLESEKTSVGNYSYLEVNHTKNNLNEFSEMTIYNKGYIPESFVSALNPKKMIWIHIDLNSCLATKGALEFLYDKVVPGGMILFDDYNWFEHEEMKSEVDEFFSKKHGFLFPLPTGQAIYFKY